MKLWFNLSQTFYLFVLNVEMTQRESAKNIKNQLSVVCICVINSLPWIFRTKRLWQVPLTPAVSQFVFRFSCVDSVDKNQPTLLYVFVFLFFYWIAQQASSLCVWLIPLAHTPSPSAAVRWKGEGTAIDPFLPHTCTHTPHLQRHYRSAWVMFLWGIGGISFLYHFTSVSHHLLMLE